MWITTDKKTRQTPWRTDSDPSWKEWIGYAMMPWMITSGGIDHLSSGNRSFGGCGSWHRGPLRGPVGHAVVFVTNKPYSMIFWTLEASFKLSVAHTQNVLVKINECGTVQITREIGTKTERWRVGDWVSGLFFCHMTVTVWTIFPMSEDGRNPWNLWRPLFQAKWCEFTCHHLRLLQDKNRYRKSGKNIAAHKRAMSQKKSWLVVKRLELQGQLAALRRWTCRTKLTRQVEKLEKSSKMKRDLPQRGSTGYACESKEKHLDQNVARKVQKWENEVFAISEGMAEDARVDDGARSRLRRALKQLRKDMEEERATRELLEEIQQNVDEAQERACESDQSLCGELKELHVLVGTRNLKTAQL